MKSLPDRYGNVAVTFHWLSAIAILVLIGSGFRAAMTVDPAAKLALLQLHVPLAVLLQRLIGSAKRDSLRPIMRQGSRTARPGTD